jgi:hypothetical protein
MKWSAIGLQDSSGSLSDVLHTIIDLSHLAHPVLIQDARSLFEPVWTAVASFTATPPAAVAVIAAVDDNASLGNDVEQIVSVKTETGMDMDTQDSESMGVANATLIQQPCTCDVSAALHQSLTILAPEATEYVNSLVGKAEILIKFSEEVIKACIPLEKCIKEFSGRM